jgi:hypothetical protein
MYVKTSFFDVLYEVEKDSKGVSAGIFSGTEEFVENLC